MQTSDSLTQRGELPHKPVITDQQCLLCTCQSDRPLCQFCLSEITCYRPTVCADNLMQQPNFREQLPQLAGHHLFSVGPHIWPLDHLISTLKYHQKSILVPELAALFAQHFRSSQQELPDAILAVPMHPIKLWLRGFNQSALLAKHIGRELGLPVLSGLARKRWSFTPQVRKTAAQRRHLDVSHFRVKRGKCPYARIAIFDDVITTGSTVASLAKALTSQYPELEIQFWSCSVSLKQK